MKKLLLRGTDACALMAGLVASELLFRSATIRDLAGRLSGRGHLVAIVTAKEFMKRTWEVRPSHGTRLNRCRESSTLRRCGDDPTRALDRELALLRAQFPHEGAFEQALRASGISPGCSTRRSRRNFADGNGWRDNFCRRDSVRAGMPAVLRIHLIFSPNRPVFVPPIFSWLPTTKRLPKSWKKKKWPLWICRNGWGRERRFPSSPRKRLKTKPRKTGEATLDISRSLACHPSLSAKSKNLRPAK